MDHILGLDAGTSVIKAALFDSHMREVAVAAQPTTLKMPHAGYVEVDMFAVWHAAASAIQAVIAQGAATADQIKAVGITGNMVGAWLIDAEGQPVRDAILFNDNRTQDMIAAYAKRHPDFHTTIFNASGSVMQPGCTIPVLRWLAEHEPDVLERAAHVLCCKEWLIYQLTGAIQMDPSQASVMPGSTHERGYAEALFDLMGVRDYRELFPSLQSAETPVGQVTKQAASYTGLQSGTPVVAGTGDVLATAIGAGAVHDGVAYTILGTACINGLVMDEPDLEPYNIGLTFCQPGGRWIRVMINVVGTPNLDWCIGQFFPDIDLKKAGFAALETVAKSSGAGAHGLIYLPYLSPTGVFAPFVESAARADFFGLTMNHTRNDVLRAVYEGVAFGIRDCYDALPHHVERIRLTGGGANSAFWSQMIADITGKQVIIPEGNEFGARGSALLAGIGIGWFDAVSDVVALTASVRTHDPQPNPAYEAAYATYQQLGAALRPVWQAAQHRSGASAYR